MSRGVTGRLRKLEAEHRDKPRRHVLRAIGAAEAERRLEALKASGEYQEGDEILRIVRVIVHPAERSDEAAGEEPRAYEGGRG